MIVFRQKLFRRDVFPSNNFLGMLPSSAGINIIVQESKKYSKQLQGMFESDRRKIKALRKDISLGNLIIDGPAGGDTHFLSDFSHKDSYVFSKKINEEDRLNYRIYRPRLIGQTEAESGSIIDVYEVKVVLESCKGHELNGTPDYVKDINYKKLKQDKNSI